LSGIVPLGQEGAGSFPAVMEQDPGLPAHTIYGLKTWLAKNGAFHRNFLSEIASHGYLAIAIGPPHAPWPAGKRQDSRYYNRLDTSKVAVMGHTCGGIQALAVQGRPGSRESVPERGLVSLQGSPVSGLGAGRRRRVGNRG
jgi:hypothetical protein